MTKGQKNNETYIEGIISTSSRGVGYVQHDDPNNKSKEIEVARENLKTALHGDRVLVQIISRASHAKPKGRIIKILTRAKEEFVGTVKKENGVYVIAPQDRHMYTDIVISSSSQKTKKARIGDKALVRIKKWDDARKRPFGEIVSVIGEAGRHETEIKAIVLDKGIALSFPPTVEGEAHEIKKRAKTTFAKESSRRRDFRKIPTFTIDPDDAKDFDDALSIQKLQNGNFEMGVHIADVTFFVKEGSAIDVEAAKRTTSIYLVDRTIPMLPEILSNDLCSLNPYEDKLTFSAVFELSPNGAVKKRWFGKTIIRSHKRFTYAGAQNALETKSGPFHKELTHLNQIARALRKKRFEKGALAFEQPEVKFELDSNGRPVRIYTKERLETNKLIEDFMILANNEVARFVSHLDKNIEKTFVYRVHELPREEKIQELANLLRALGYKVSDKHIPQTAQGIEKLLSIVKDDAHKHIVQMATIQAMERAIYSTKDTGHFGLSLKHYTHFTSPIRRYPDMMVHRFLETYLGGKKIPKEKFGEYEALTRYVSQVERIADEAQWASIKYKQTEYMSERVGREYDGIITGLTERGIFVREEETLSEGMVRLRDMKDDYYVYNNKAFSVVGERTKKKYTIGDKVRIKVFRTDVEKRFIDYVFV